MRYYILDSQEESDQCLKECLTAFLQNIKNEHYKQQTTEWAFEQQRLTDSKYIVPVCSYLGTFGYQIETATDDWFPPMTDN